MNREYKPSNIEGQLFAASLRFIRENESLVNKKAKQVINKRGYIKSARVVQVTKCNDIAKVTLRADGAKIDINVGLNELDRVYSNPIAYAEKWI